MRHILLGAYALVCLACLVWPVYGEVGAHIEPFVFGLPFSFAWVVGWGVLTFAVLCAYHFADERATEPPGPPRAQLLAGSTASSTDRSSGESAGEP